MDAQKGRGHEDDYVQTILFTAGTFFVIACIKQAIEISLIQEWRAWVFVVLNIVLLAIAFTSTSRKVSYQETKGADNKSSKNLVGVEEHEECYYSMLDCNKIEHEVVVEEEIDVMTDQKLPSPEELHERAEAFIAMFRQQLVKDAIKGRKNLHGGAEGCKFYTHQVCPSLQGRVV